MQLLWRQAITWIISALLLSSCMVADPKPSNTPQSSSTSQRVALVIGNGGYRFAGRLVNPPNDADRIAARLSELGFSVIKGIDLNTKAMSDALERFSQRLVSADVGLFFYAGHGIQVSGRNYLIPVDIRFDETLITQMGQLEARALSLSRVLAELESKPRVSLVFLDACRTNPLVAPLLASEDPGRGQVMNRLDRSGRVVESAVLLQGLAQVETSSRSNTFIAFATQPGNVALDGSGANSPFTEAMVRYLPLPGLEVRQLLTRVRRDVLQQTNQRQIPWDQASLTAPFFFRMAPTVSMPPP